MSPAHGISLDACAMTKVDGTIDPLDRRSVSADRPRGLHRSLGSSKLSASSAGRLRADNWLHMLVTNPGKRSTSNFRGGLAL